jgi:hypothetical protein
LERFEEAVAGHAVALDDLPALRSRSIRDHGQDEVLDGDVLVFEPLGLLFGSHEDLVEPPADVDLPRFDSGARNAGALLQDRLQVRPEIAHAGTHLGQEAREKTIRLIHQRH